jgi:predicted DNA-binding antitoxin AbrB/MazE fold protein
MTKNIEAIYEHGVLRLKEPIALEDGAQVEVIVTSREPATSSPSEIVSDISRLVEECAIDTGIPDLADQHDHYLYGKQKKEGHDAESTG